MNKKFRIAIIGAGPAGMSAAARAAELDISHVLIEATPVCANTIRRFQKRKLVMAEPALLPLRSSLSFGVGIREDILQRWDDELEGLKVNVNTGTGVTGISGQEGNFQITLASGVSLQAEYVVLAIGLQGNIRKLGVEGEDLAGVQYQLDDPEEFNNETIVVVGAGDAGVENALALSEQNRVILINREEEFSQCKSANFDLLMEAVTKGKIETRVSTTTARIAAGKENDLPLIYVAQTPQGAEQIKCDRILARLGARPPRQLVESFGVHFPNNESTAVPQLSEQYETNVPGLYIVGALAGYPLIKQAMNQGYEVVEYIQGHAVEPADEMLLKDKFKGVPGVSSVSQGIAWIKNTLPLFATMTSLQMREFMLDSVVHIPAQGEVIFKRDDYCSDFYSVLSGSVSIQTEHKPQSVSAFNIAAGNFFGEIALLSGRRRSGTAIANENCVLIETPRRSILKLLHSLPAVRRTLDGVALKRVVQNSFGATLGESQFELLIQGAKLKKYATGDVLFSEGDQADGLYMIQRGSVTVSRLVQGLESVLAYVPAGHYVGEMALVSKQPRTATVRAASPTEVILLDAERVKTVIQNNPSIRGKVDSRYLQRLSTEGMASSSNFSGLAKFLIEHGVGEATDILLIDYDKCIRCDNCQTACSDAHGGTARLDREAGPTYGQVHVPNACRHCEHPHCMKDCPPDAIHRSPSGAVFIDDTCIGCGNCERNCPYDAIKMAAFVPPQPRSIWQIMLGKDNSLPISSPENSTKKAVKCDLCQGLGTGPLCVNACPTGAAYRASPEAFFAGKDGVGTVMRDDK